MELFSWSCLSEKQSGSRNITDHLGWVNAVFYSSTLTRFLGSVLPRGCWGSATSRLSCRWCFWVPCQSVGKANTTTPWEAAKPKVGTTSKPVLWHSALLYKGQFKLRKWVVPYTPLETFWRRKLGIHHAKQSSQFYMHCCLTWSYCDSGYCVPLGAPILGTQEYTRVSLLKTKGRKAIFCHRLNFETPWCRISTCKSFKVYFTLMLFIMCDWLTNLLTWQVFLLYQYRARLLLF